MDFSLLLFIGTAFTFGMVVNFTTLPPMVGFLLAGFVLNFFFIVEIIHFPDGLSKVEDQILIACNWVQCAGKADKKLYCGPFLSNALARGLLSSSEIQVGFL